MIEAEHIRFDDPSPRRHSVEAESTVIVGERNQAALALGGANRRSRDGLVIGFDRTRLPKRKWQAHCQKHENFEH